MDTMNKEQQASSQNELDLGLNHEPVTPKKTIQTPESFLDKAKGLFGKKEAAETQFHVRKEPTFGEPSNVDAQPFVSHDSLKPASEPAAPVQDETDVIAENVIEPVAAEIKTEQDNNESTESVVETVVAPAAAASRAIAQPEKWKILQILPAKHRRLFMAILILVVLLLIIWALKPSSNTVESFTQQTGNEIPVQFQSLDQEQPVETSILDNPAPAPMAEQTATESNAESTPPKMEYVGNNAQPAQEAIQPAVEQNVPAAQQPTAALQPAPVVMPQPKAETAKAPVAQPQTPVHTVKSAVEKPSVSAKPVAPQATVKKEVKATEKPQTVAKTGKNAPIVEAKPVQVKKEQKAPIVEAKAASQGAHKTLTVPQGVSLMQVFRDNQLNISDVNAMTKAQGAGNTLSSLKAGDKVQVSLNGQGRVNELRLSNGARFIRQADGSYQYKK